jgi:methionyl-tRNA formyltransferase
LVDTLKGLAENTIKELAQDLLSQPLRHAPKIFKEDMKIDWSKNAISIINHIRGLSPYPAAFTSLEGKNIKIYAAKIVNEQPNVSFGTYQTDHKTFLRFAAKDAWVYILDLQQEGKKRMEIKAFLSGFRS